MGREWTSDEWDALDYMGLLPPTFENTPWGEITQMVNEARGTHFTPEELKALWAEWKAQPDPEQPRPSKGASVNRKKGSKGLKERNLEIGKRYNELMAEKVPWKEAAAKVNQEFNTNLDYGTVRSYGSSAKKRAAVIEESTAPAETLLPAEQAEGYEHIEPVETFDEYAEQYEHKEPPQLPDERASHYDDKGLEQRMREIAREVVTEMMNVQNIHTIMANTADEPPAPETIKGKGRGRKETRDYDRITLTVDKVLAGRFKAEAQRRGVSAGRLADIIFWHYFGKPKLSYQEPDENN